MTDSNLKAPALTDADCMQFLKAAMVVGLLNLVRLIHEDGFHQGVVAREDAE